MSAGGAAAKAAPLTWRQRDCTVAANVVAGRPGGGAVFRRTDRPQRLRCAPGVPAVPVQQRPAPPPPAGAPGPAGGAAPHGAVACLQRSLCRRAADRRGRPPPLPSGPFRSPGAGRLDGRDQPHRPPGRGALEGSRAVDPLPPPRGAERFQGGRARRRVAPRRGRADRRLRCRFRAAPGLSRARRGRVRRSPGRHGPGPLGARQPPLLAAHPPAGAAARRPLRAGGTGAGIAAAASSISTAPPASGGVPRSSRPAGGSTTRSPRIST